MQPGYTPQPIYNNFSSQLLTARTEWEKKLGIEPNEMLVFRAIGTGKTKNIKYKSTAKAAEYSDFEEMKPAPKSFCAVNQISIPDKGAVGGYVQLAYFENGYAPGKIKAPLMFMGDDETVIKVIPEENPALYDMLSFSPQLGNGMVKMRGVAPAFELLRPDEMVETSLKDEIKLASVISRVASTPYSLLQHLAPKLSLPSDTSTEERMQQNFIQYAKTNAGSANRLEALLEADETKFFQSVEKAIAADVIAVNKDKSMWVFGATQEGITPASPDRNTIDQLVGFLMLEPGQVTYKQILSLTAKAKK